MCHAGYNSYLPLIVFGVATGTNGRIKSMKRYRNDSPTGRKRVPEKEGKDIVMYSVELLRTIEIVYRIIGILHKLDKRL